MHESLKVYLKDSFVGWLSHETVGDEYSFEYNKDYLANPVEGALAPLYDLVSTVVYPELSREIVESRSDLLSIVWRCQILRPRPYITVPLG